MGKRECEYKWVDGVRICHEPMWERSEGGFCIFHDPNFTKDTELFDQNLKKKLQEKNYDFRGYCFPENINFCGEDFSMPTSFENAYFYGMVSFYVTQFTKVDFSNAIFSQWVFFGNAVFSDSAQFTDTQFRSMACFIAATFQNADFRGATFSEEASFEEGTFGNCAEFGSSHFLKSVSFEKAGFFGRTGFQNTKFSGPTSFSKVEFLGAVDFTCSDFSDKTRFNDARFSLGALFLKTEFCNRAFFHGSSFSELADFTNTNFCNGADFGETNFSKEILFADSCFEGAASFEKCNLQRLETQPPFRNLDEFESGYRIVKNCLNERGDYATAGQFYYLEMDAKRKHSQNLRRLWLEAYRFICGYGEAPQRVLAVSLLIILGWAGMFFFSGIAVNPSSTGERIIDYSLAIPQDISLDNVRDLGYCIYCSVVTFTTLGYGDICPLGYSRLLASVEAFIGAFFIALFVLVFGRKMMR